MNVIHISYDNDVTENRSPNMGLLLLRMQKRMIECRWLQENRNARPTDNPDTWDHDEIERLDEQFDEVFSDVYL